MDALIKYKLLDIFFTTFHSTLIIFNLFGWLWRKTRKINLITLTLTGFSWFFIGIFYGIGYCPLTDWHWKILVILGQNDLPTSYIQYLVIRVTGFSLSISLIELLTVLLYFIALVISIYCNFRGIIKRTLKFPFLKHMLF